MRHRATILLASLFALLTLAAPAFGQADKNCDDFASQGKAQEYFKGYGGSATNNVDNLDADHDGWACESYPYQGMAADGSTPKQTTPPAAQQGDTPADRGERLADTGTGDVTRTAGAGLLVGGLLLVAATRYRPRHAR